VQGRTWNTTALDDGTYQTVMYPDSVNYKTADGTWQPIDDTLVPSPDGAGYRNTANRYQVEFPAAISSPVQVTLGKDWVSTQLVGAKGPGSVSGPTDTYKEALPGVTASYTADSDQVKEDLTLESVAGPSTFTFQVNASQGLTASTGPGGAVQFTASSGQVVFSLVAPIMVDAAGAVSSGVTAALVQGLAGTTVTVSADPKWLADPTRVWPVTVDPTVTLGPSQDCYIWQQYPSGGNCTATTLTVANPGAMLTRALLQFDVSGALSFPQVLSADLGLYLTSESSSTVTTVSAYPLTQSWGSAVTWTSRDGANNWTTQGGTYSTTNATSSNVGGSIGWYHWAPTSLVQSWINGTTPNDGFLLTQSVSGTTNTFQFASSEYSDPTKRPSLAVTWAAGTGEQSYYDMIRHTLTDRMDLAVNVSNGNLVVHESDLRVKGTGLDLAVDRYYNSSSSATLKDLGKGWVMGTGADVGLTVAQNGDVTYAGPSGYQIVFTKNPDGTYTSPTGIDATLTKPGSTYTLTFQKSGEKYNFSSGGFLTSDVDKNGNQISFAYNGNNNLVSITDTQGRVTTFAYTAQPFKVSSMTDSSGRVYSYGYDGSSYVTSYTDPAGGVTSFAYTEGKLTRITDPLGNQTKLTYDSNGRVASIIYVTDPGTGAGYTTTFAYDPGSTLVTDSNGHTTEHDFDLLGRVTKLVDPLGNVSTYSYTSDSHVSQGNNGVGTTQYAFDSFNNLTQLTEPASTSSSWAYTSGAFPYYPTSYTDTQANTSSYGYGTNGNLTTVTDALGHVTTYAYNANGTMASVTDARGNVTSYSYDAKGNLTGITYPAPLGAASFTYDTLSRVKTGTDGKGQTTRYAYDALDRLTTVTYSDHTSVSFTYDADGNVTAMTDGTGTTTYAYDALNRATSKTLPSGQVISYAYDGEGNLTSKTDNGGTTNYAYDAANELTSLTFGGSSTLTFGYDAAHRRIRTSYPNGVVVSTTRDSSGKPTSIAAKKGSTTLQSRAYGYSEDLIHSATDEVGNITVYGYDGLNRLTSAIVDGPNPASYSYVYDPVGNLTSKTINGVNTTYSYNAANELTSGGGLTYTNDADGNLTARSDGLALLYNSGSFTTSITSPGGAAISMTYTGLDQTQRTQAGSTSFVYDQQGLSQRTAGGSTTYEVRDDSGALLAERMPSGNYYVISDILSSTIGLTNSQGTLVSTWTYDPWGQLVSSTGTITTPLLFVSAYFDQATGLYKAGARDYDPSVGRWIQPDGGGAGRSCVPPLSADSRFLYVTDDPVNRTDPSGQFGFGCFALCVIENLPLGAGCYTACWIAAHGGWLGALFAGFTCLYCAWTLFHDAIYGCVRRCR